MAKRALRNKARSARKTSRRPHLAPPRPRPVAADVRRDDSGQLWNLRNIEREIGAILALLAPGWTAAAIVRTTRLEDDLGFDSWGVLRVVKPVRMRLHETLSDSVVRDLKKVGDLVDYVWAKMEDVS